MTRYFVEYTCWRPSNIQAATPNDLLLIQKLCEQVGITVY